MDKQTLIELTSNLYRLTLLFPKKEPLRYKMREAAIDILARPNEKDLEILDSYFEIALVQNWVSPSEILAMKRQYDSLITELKSEEPKEEAKEKAKEKQKGETTVKQNKNPLTVNPANNFVAVHAASNPTENQSIIRGSEIDTKKQINSRQEKILEFLKKNGQAQVWQIKEIMPDITKRTLRRDFEYMLRQQIIERIGERNNTFYKIKTDQA